MVKFVWSIRSTLEYTRVFSYGLYDRLCNIERVLKQGEEGYPFQDEAKMLVLENLVSFFTIRDGPKLARLKVLAKPFGYTELILVLEILYNKNRNNEPITVKEVYDAGFQWVNTFAPLILKLYSPEALKSLEELE